MRKKYSITKKILKHSGTSTNGKQLETGEKAENVPNSSVTMSGQARA